MAMIHVFGIGPGSTEMIIKQFDNIIQSSDVVIGSRRQLQVIPKKFSGKKIILPKLNQLLTILKDYLAKDKTIVILASGDPLFFGIGSYMINQFGTDKVYIYPGISSVQYLFNKIGLSMNDCYLTSSHGRIVDFGNLVTQKKIGMVTDEINGPYEVAQGLLRQGLTEATVYIGENLSYENEKITKFRLEEVPDKEYQMNVVVITR